MQCGDSGNVNQDPPGWTRQGMIADKLNRFRIGVRARNLRGIACGAI